MDRRPALVINHTRFNEKVGLCVVCPIINTDRGIPFYIFVQSTKLSGFVMTEQIVGRLLLDKKINISSETIYRFILQDEAIDGNLYTYLRHQHKKYRKRYSKNNYRGRVPNRIDIDNRPSIVDTRTHIGDWEADTIIGKSHKGAILSLAERKSRLYLVLPIKRKTADNTHNAITALLQPMKEVVHTITFDNGKEFNKHSSVAKTLDCNTYFAKPSPTKRFK